MRKALLFVLTYSLIICLAVGCGAPPEAADATPTPEIESEADDVMGDYVEPEPVYTPVTEPLNTPPPEPTPVTFPADAYICKEGVNLRAEATTSSSIVDVMGENYPVRVVSLQDGWYRLDLDGKTAYVREDMAALGEPPRKHNIFWAKVNVNEAKLYKSPSSNEPSDRKLEKDEVVKVLRTLDGYSHVVCSDFLQRYVLATEITKIPDDEAGR